MSKLTGHLLRSKDGQAQVIAKGRSLEWLMTTGPGCSAILRLRSATSRNYEESSFSPSKGVPALTRSTVRVAGKAVEKSMVTEYTTKTIRTDTITAEGEVFTRKVQWKYLHDIEVHAEYHPGVRTLTICKGGKKVAAFETTGSYTTAGFRTVTRALDGYPKIFSINGKKAISEHTTFAPVQVLASAIYGPTIPSAGTSVVTTTPNNDGSITVTQTATSPEGQYVNTVNIGSDSHVTSQQIDSNTTNTTGGVTTSEGVHIETDGTGTGSYSESQAGTLAGGGFWVNSSTTDTSNGTSQSSSYVNDGQGNEIQVTTTTNADGSYNTTTTTKDANGNVNTTSQDYDKDGNPVGPPTDSDKQQDPPPPPTGGTEYPSDDGTDYNTGSSGGPSVAGKSSGPSLTGPVDHVISGWQDGMDPFMGGNPAVIPTINPGDPPPYEAIAAAVNSDGAGLGGGSFQAVTSASMDLSVFTPARDSDPDLNPRAMIGVLASSSGLSSASGAIVAATQAAAGLKAV